MTKHGFYSVVQKRAGEFHVRGRERTDLQNLVREAALSNKIIETPDADYRFRIIVNATGFKKIMQTLESSLDYSNFKSHIAATPDQKHKLNAYHKIWDIMQRLQSTSQIETPLSAPVDDEDDDNEIDEGKFPWEHVEASRKNARLQKRHPSAEIAQLIAKAKPCPKCDAQPQQLSWFYFSSPSWTWEHECGQEGWMVVCDKCHEQIDFFLEVIS